MLARRLRRAVPKGAAPGQQAWTTAGTASWTVPAGVTSVCILCVGGGGGVAISYNVVVKNGDGGCVDGALG